MMLVYLIYYVKLSSYSFADGVLVDTYLHEPTDSIQLYSYDVNSPRSFRASVQIEVVGCDLGNFLLFTPCHGFFWKAEVTAPARFYFYEDQVLSIFSYKVNFSIGATEVSFQDTVTLAYELIGCQPLTSTAQALTGAHWFFLAVGSSSSVGYWTFHYVLRTPLVCVVERH
jgi:hypothetical protein